MPSQIVTNDDLAQRLDTSDHWIRERTGIGARRISKPEDRCADFAIQAAREAIQCAGIQASDVDLIVVATSTADQVFPSTACLVQQAIGATRASAFDISAACAGFVFALDIANCAIRSERCRCVLVIGSERMSTILDWEDRNTCVLFGDGAGALVLRAGKQPGGLVACFTRADGSGASLLYIKNPAGPNKLHMDGRAVFRFASNVIGQAIREIAQSAQWALGQVHLVVSHQANLRIIETAARNTGLPLDRFFCNIEQYGNTSAASIPIALCEAIETQRLRLHDKLILVGFGGGLVWGAVAVEWSKPMHTPASKQPTQSKFHLPTSTPAPSLTSSMRDEQVHEGSQIDVMHT